MTDGTKPTNCWTLRWQRMGAQGRAGLEQRVLERVRTAKRRPTFAWLVTASLAALAAMVFCWPSPVKDLPLPKRRPPQAMTIQADVLAAPESAAVRQFSPPRKRLPRLAQFPRSSPLTEEERLLIAFAHSPEDRRVLLADEHPRPIEPIHIEELQKVDLNLADRSGR